MTVLAELARLYERLREQGKAPAPGYSMEKIGGELVLDAKGHVLAIRDLRVPAENGRPQPRVMAVPAAFKRTSGTKANTLWDKTSYSLGLTLLKDEKGKPQLGDDGLPQPLRDDKTAKEHAAFVASHEEMLADTTDPGLQALLAFVRGWRPEQFEDWAQAPALLDENMVFRLDSDLKEDGTPRYIHERVAARALLRNRDTEDAELCLVTGEPGPVARLHPAIKGVAGAQSSGASLVSFNLDAFTSFGKEQGENAPVSEAAAFAYGTALNALLAKGSGRNLRIGDATVVFWAEAAGGAQVTRIEDLLMGALAPDEQAETNKLRALLQNVAAGRGTAPEGFAPETRIFILGLAPNAARLSLRFWRPGTLGDFARNVTRFWDDLALDPPAWKGPPAAWSLLYETALQRKAENIPPRLGGDLMQAVLTGAPYPRTLLTATVNRIRSDHDINGRRVAIIAAVLRRNLKEEIPMSLDRNNPDPAYRLGRLFAVLEGIQQSALPGLNATIKDRYFAAASATPARVFPLLVKTATHHLSNLRKADKAGLAHWFEAEMGEIWSALEADLPRSLNLEDQGRFIAGYYHQRWARKEQPEDTADKAIETEGAAE